MREDRPHPAERRSDDEAGQSVLAKRRIHDSIFTELIHQLRSRSENPFRIGHAEANHKNVWVALETNRRAVTNGLGIGQVARWRRFAHGANTPFCRVTGSGLALAQTFSMTESIS